MYTGDFWVTSVSIDLNIKFTTMNRYVTASVLGVILGTLAGFLTTPQIFTDMTGVYFFGSSFCCFSTLVYIARGNRILPLVFAGVAAAMLTVACWIYVNGAGGSV